MRLPRRQLLFLALGVGLAWVVLACWLLPSYGPAWDSVIGEYPHGEAFLNTILTGESYLEHLDGDTGARPRQPHPDFDQYRLHWHGTYPLTGLFSALSCRVLWTELGLVPPLLAHNLPGVLLLGVLLVVVVRVAGARYGPLVGVGAAVLLVCTPRYFAHSFNNLKDAPEACLYVLAALALYCALLFDRLRTWLLAGVLVGLALAQRPNALLLPVQMLLFYVGAIIVRALRGEGTPWSWRGLGTSLAAFAAVYFACSPAFWEDPANVLWQLDYHLGFNLFVGQKESSVSMDAFGTTGVSTHGVLLFAWSTPPVTLIAALVGLFHPRLRGEERLFLVLGIAVPVGRTLVPGMVNYDGVRHFLEVFPPLAVLAALGLDVAARSVKRALASLRGPWPSLAAGALVAALLANPVLAIARTHPNGVAYFNAFVGGLRGAQEHGYSDATDYWANSYWQGLEWISHHAEEGAFLHVPVADHVARCAAPVRLRSDVRLVPPNAPDGAPLYVMYVTRSGLYRPLVARLDAEHDPVHEIRVQGAPILRILRLEGEEARDAAATVDLEGRAHRAADRINLWLREHPELVREVYLELIDPDASQEVIVGELRSLLPPDLHEDLPLVVWLFRGPRSPTGTDPPSPR